MIGGRHRGAARYYRNSVCFRGTPMIGALLFTIPIALTAGLAGGFISRLLSPARQPNSEPGVIRATNLALVDDRGRERAVLALIRGRPMLVLSDEYTLPT